MVRTEYLSQKNKRPRGVLVPITESQKKARNRMVEVLLADKTSDDSLVQSVHELCSALLQANLSDSPKKGFAFELALCIYSYRLILNASQVTQLFAGMQSCFRLILAHIVRLKSQGKTLYTDPLLPSPSSSQAEATPSFQVIDENQQNTQNNHVSGDSEWPEAELEDEVEVSEDNSEILATHPDSSSLLR